MEEKEKFCLRNVCNNKELPRQKARFEAEKEHKRVSSAREEMHLNDTTEKEKENFQKQSHNKLKACIQQESKAMVCKILRQNEKKSSRIPSHRCTKETRNESLKTDASHQSRNCKVAAKFPPVNDIVENMKHSEVIVNKVDINMPSFNQNTHNSKNRSNKQSVNISEELGIRSNDCDKSTKANGHSCIGLSEEIQRNSSDFNVKFFSLSENNCAYSKMTNISVMSNAVVGDLNQSCGYENVHSNNLSVSDVYIEQKEDSVICSSGNVFTFCEPSCESPAFSDFKLEDLLHYNVNLMQGRRLLDYAFALRDKIMQRIGEFKSNVRVELEFLCALSDGTQTEKNQMLITERTHYVIKNLLQQPVQTDTIATPSKEPASSPLLSSHPESNSPRVLDISRASYTQAGNYICKSPGTQTLVTTERSDLMESNGENIEHVTLEKNVHPYDDRLFIENSAKIWDSDNHNAYKNNKVNSTMGDSSVEKYVKHRSAAINSKDAKHSVEESTFSSFRLSNLLNFNIDAMQGNLLLHYAFTVKERVLEMLHEFEDPVIKDKLEFMCEITDGSQTEENQKVITERMCNFISEYFKSYVPEITQNYRGIMQNCRGITQNYRETTQDCGKIRRYSEQRKNQ